MFSPKRGWVIYAAGGGIVTEWTVVGTYAAFHVRLWVLELLGT